MAVEKEPVPNELPNEMLQYRSLLFALLLEVLTQVAED
jgi:hypothetical protein